MLKDEMLPNKSRIAALREVMTVLSRAVCDLAAACVECDGSYDTVEAVRNATDAVSDAGDECADHVDAVVTGAYRSCDRLT
jgi:hypothetical protein